MRVFIAIEFEKEIKKYLKEIQQKVIEKSIRGNFTSIDNFHLTIRFIGEVNQVGFQLIREAVDQAALSTENFILQLGDIGYFSRKNKKIVWVGLKGDISKLNSLYNNLESQLELKGFKREERGYNPHITLGREVILKDSNGEVKDIATIENRAVAVSKISIMESTRENGRLVYKARYVKQFNEK